MTLDTLPPLRVGIMEAARLVGISRAALYQRILAGKLVVQKDGKRTLIAIDELRRYVDACAAQTRDAA